MKKGEGMVEKNFLPSYDFLSSEYRGLKRVNNKLLKTLKMAKEHLEYCNYGDSWERECAKEIKLEEVIEKTIKQAEKYLSK